MIKKFLLFTLSASISVLVNLEAEPATIASVPTDAGPLEVQSEKEGKIEVSVGSTSVVLDAEAGLRAAEWLKRGEVGVYKDGPMTFQRGTKELTLALAGDGPQSVRIQDDWITQLAAALATARQSAKNIEKGLEKP